MKFEDFERLNQLERYDVNMDYAEFICAHTILNKKYDLNILG